ncbi:MAG TPA: hypothetical protein DCW90_08650 [Lachnospiraceae bacterium]|nr:hypothetical protein [Lachnospiraceae bacterium]
MAVTPNIGKLVDLELLKAFKAKQDAAFDAKLDEKEALGTAAGLVGELSTLTTEAKGTVAAAINEVDANADAAKAAADAAQKAADANKATLDQLTGAEGIDKKIQDAVDGVNATIGKTTDLTTTEQGTIVGAINEVKAATETLNTASKVTLDADDTARVYKIYQGGSETSNLVGTINIGKDLVVKSGAVKEVPEKGTCIVLTLTNDEVVEIPAASLIDIYTAETGATEVQVAIDPTSKKVGASLVTGGVAKTKLAADVQASLGKADTAVQTVAEGTADGTIAVDGKDVTVHGFAAVKSTADAAKATADKLDGTAETEGSVKYQIAASETAVKAAVKVDTDALAGRAQALEDWKATVGLASEDDINALFA